MLGERVDEPLHRITRSARVEVGVEEVQRLPDWIGMCLHVDVLSLQRTVKIRGRGSASVKSVTQCVALVRRPCGLPFRREEMRQPCALQMRRAAMKNVSDLRFDSGEVERVEESRGAHFRTDFAQKYSAFQKHSILRRTDNGFDAQIHFA